MELNESQLGQAPAHEALLSEVERAAFHRDGYLHLPGVISRERIALALTAINADLGRGLAPARISFPLSAQEREAAPRSQLCPHVDGSYSPSNGVRPGQVAHFTLLCMVALSDVATDFAGNFTVWPGSHQLYERYFQTHDVRDMLQGTPRLEHLPEPRQLRVRAGDVVLELGVRGAPAEAVQLGHTGAPNLSAQIRYAVFFRLYHEHHDPDALDILADIWREFPSLQRPRG